MISNVSGFTRSAWCFSFLLGAGITAISRPAGAQTAGVPGGVASASSGARSRAPEPGFAPRQAESKSAGGIRLAQDAMAVLTLDLAHATRPISPMLYGLMIEDINHSIDGGLYGELIQNRVFKDDANVPVHWSVVPGSMAGTITLDTGQPIPETALTTSLRLDISGAEGAGIANDGYWGIPVRPNTPYRASFYAKANSDFAGPIRVAIESNDGNTVFAEARVRKISKQWKKYTITLRTGNVSPSTANRFVISARSKGTLWFNQVSLFPPTWKKRANGTRIDLMQLLDNMKPAFLRLPGGNYLEGNTIAERFEWKDTIHSVSMRPGHQNPWNYRSDDGFGLLEYLQWCEDLHMAPVLAVFAGYSLRGEHVTPGPDLQPYVQDALDELEYVVGGTDTHWGAQRAADGHPAPFPLTYVEIGNEDGFDRSKSYDGRFTQFYDAIKAAYPKLQLIATTNVKTRRPDVIDEHYYRTARAMEADAGHYDNYDRSGPKIFVGEWASQDVDRPWEQPEKKGPTPTLNSALGDAAWMTGMEKNGDIVILSAYAPLLVNVNPGARQWALNLIGYDAMTSYGSPSYYAQKMFSTTVGDVMVPATLSGSSTLYYVASRANKSGSCYVKVVNATSQAQTVQIVLEGARSVGSEASAMVLGSSSLADTNTLADPMRVVPITTHFKPEGSTFRYTFAPYSVNVLTLSVR